MGVVQNITDGLKNVVANLGTPRDKASHTSYANEFLSAYDLNTIYRNSWVARDGVNFPAEDATRNWRNWRAEAEQITAIEAEEKRLDLQAKMQRALKMARLYGGAALYINTGDSQQSTPLRPGREIQSLVVLTKNDLRPKEIVKDINSPYFGAAEFYTLTTGDRAQQIDIHASRLVILSGTDSLQDRNYSVTDSVWGDSVIQAAHDALTQRDSTMANVASLVFEAKVDVFKFEGFADMLAQGHDAKLISRLSLQATQKGISGAVALDAKDDYEQKNASFGGLTEIIGKFQEEVSGAFGIPVTRFFGRSSVGLSGNGDGDERVYYDRINQNQRLNIGPAMALLDECIITQALGSRPPEIYSEWAPLRQLTESERAEIFSKTATAARALAGTNAGEIIPLDALSDSLVNEFTEMGSLPGLEQKIEEYGTLAAQNGFNEDDITPRRFGDAAPRTLYVSRRVTNAAEIIKHYADQGVYNRLSADDLHVTIMYSRQPVDWMRIGESWQGTVTISEGGPRIMEAFGPSEDTLVLAFSSDELRWRHKAIKEQGASWDWPEYQPHITIANEFDGDVSAVEPWQGAIELGPEIFEEVSE